MYYTLYRDSANGVVWITEKEEFIIMLIDLISKIKDIYPRLTPRQKTSLVDLF